MSERRDVAIYTDGACIGNPGPGGYGVVLLFGENRKELSGGFLRTTNNRMEVLAAIEGLKLLNEKCSVTLYSDSRYLVEAMEKGWASRWKKKGWRRNKKEKALNPDLWDALLGLCEYHAVRFEWVKGHSGNPENERCDQLATAAASEPNLPRDTGYENPVISQAGLW